MCKFVCVASLCGLSNDMDYDFRLWLISGPQLAPVEHFLFGRVAVAAISIAVSSLLQ